MPQQVNSQPTRKVLVGGIVSGVAAPIWGYFSTLIVYLINGMAWHCWVDPNSVAAAASATAAAWTCPMHLPDFVATAVQGIVTAIGTGLSGYAVGYAVSPSSSDHVTGVPGS